MKLQLEVDGALVIGSHPTGVRGLKFDNYMKNDVPDDSRPPLGCVD